MVEPDFYFDRAAAILAGGENRRMGTDKSLLPFPDKPLVLTLAERLAPLVEQTLVITADPKPYRRLGLNAFEDAFPGKGSLVGLASALKHSQAVWTFVQACDMPFIPPVLIKKLFSMTTDTLGVIPVTDRGWEPLCAVYHRRLLPILSQALENKVMRIRDAIEDQPLTLVPARALPGDTRQAFVNINTPEQYQQALKTLTKNPR